MSACSILLKSTTKKRHPRSALLIGLRTRFMQQVMPLYSRILHASLRKATKWAASSNGADALPEPRHIHARPYIGAVKSHSWAATTSSLHQQGRREPGKLTTDTTPTNMRLSAAVLIGKKRVPSLPTYKCWAMRNLFWVVVPGALEHILAMQALLCRKTVLRQQSPSSPAGTLVACQPC